METLDNPLFDHLLGFLTAKEACSLAVQSVALRQAVDKSTLWKTWCERLNPSITTSPAKELVQKHYGVRSDPNKNSAYKQLYRRSSGRRSTCDEASQVEEGGSDVPDLSGYVMLMDVYWKGFLTAKEACSLALQSVALRQAVDESTLWKTWCERLNPSITTSPAKELVQRLYGVRSGENKSSAYKQLYRRLSGRRGACDKASRNEEGASSSDDVSDLSGYVMLMDIYWEGEGRLFCSAEASELDRSFQGCQEDWEFNHSENRGCKAVVKLLHGPVGRTVCHELLRFLDRTSEISVIPPTNGELFKIHDDDLEELSLLSFSWKLFRKKDGKVLRLLECEAPTQWGFVHPVGGRWYRRLQASAVVDVPEELRDDRSFLQAMILGDTRSCQAVMRLRCYKDEDLRHQTTENATERATFNSCNDFAVEIGLMPWGLFRELVLRFYRLDPNKNLLEDDAYVELGRVLSLLQEEAIVDMWV
ncbi:hypothetical protein KFL_001360060 [Klebsormidium nitens]|uniref:F-box domain-containing protein n=1 Tax=Klebsormidium nitens TaxID=105231 RepID=A0A1Y1I0Y9_KLENI|nr:hypothetical protein KFL_001360060 [Klebsormidium nitens]|eukprot:GAQ83109.1 hypothetical protein KFL_001360060 [Klebsormidium nitens]